MKVVLDWVGSLEGRMEVVELVIVAAVRRREVCIDILDGLPRQCGCNECEGWSSRAEGDVAAMLSGRMRRCEVDAIQAEKLSRVM